MAHIKYPRHRQHAVMLAAAIALHIGLVYALKTGSIPHNGQPLPRTMRVTLIAAKPPMPIQPKAIIPASPTKPPMPVARTTKPKLNRHRSHRGSQRSASAPPPPREIADKSEDKSMQQAEAPATSPPISPSTTRAAVSHAAPQPAPTSATPVAPKTISSGIEYIQPPQPDYPPIARKMEEEGKVTLRVLVNEQGRAQHVEIQRTSGSTMLDEAARQAMMHAVFKPHIEDGRAVAMNAIAVITFKLDQ